MQTRLKVSTIQNVPFASSTCLKNREQLYTTAISPFVGQSKTILDSGFHAVDSGFQVLDFFVSKIWILDSSRWWDSGFFELYSGLQRPGFQILRANYRIATKLFLFFIICKPFALANKPGS